jgi:hypothetical protein
MAINLTTIDPTATKFDLTALTSADIHQLTAVELRKLGSQCGIKGASRGKRDELLKALTIVRASQLKAKAEAEEKAKAEAEAKAAAEASAKAAAEATNDDGPVTVRKGQPRTGFAIPKPAVEKATRPRAGVSISRQGQIVRAKGNKAEVVRAAAAAIGYAVKIAVKGGQTILTATSEFRQLCLVWDDRGRYVYPASKWETSDGDGNTVIRRVRNVSEALRLIEI